MSTAKVTRCSVAKTGAKEYVTVLEDMEFYFPVRQLSEIAKQWNNGVHILDLAEEYRRPAEEIFLALFHLARKGKIKRPLARRI